MSKCTEPVAVEAQEEFEHRVIKALYKAGRPLDRIRDFERLYLDGVTPSEGSDKIENIFAFAAAFCRNQRSTETSIELVNFCFRIFNTTGNCIPLLTVWQLFFLSQRFQDHMMAANIIINLSPQDRRVARDVAKRTENLIPECRSHGDVGLCVRLREVNLYLETNIHDEELVDLIIDVASVTRDLRTANHYFNYALALEIPLSRDTLLSYGNLLSCNKMKTPDKDKAEFQTRKNKTIARRPAPKPKV